VSGGRRPAAVLATALAAFGCGTTDGDGIVPQGETVETVATAFTQRLTAPDPETQAIVLTQVTYPATREENAPGAIILTVPDPVIAFTAMQRVTHMPVNAPLLYLDAEGRLPEATLREMRRLRPDGVMQDGQVQVYVVGPYDPSVVVVIEEELGYEPRTFPMEDPVQLADTLDRWQAALKSDHPDEVVVSAVDHPDGIAHGIGAMGWNAHMGRGFAWVFRDSVPDATRRILSRRAGEAYIYITGGEDVVSRDVALELAEYGPVRRIAGPTVFASNAVNAGYKDYGRNWGYWWDAQTRMFGWGIAQAGHNFIVGSAEDMLGMIPAAVLGHMGKHGPILLVSRDSVPTATRDYLEMVKPDAPSPTETILNFAWIIGDAARVSPAVQREIDGLLSPWRLDEPRRVVAPQAPVDAATSVSPNRGR
jgi:hypothetical protein